MLKQGGSFYWLKIIIILAAVGAGFFCGEKVWASVLINEIMYNPAGLDTDNEWIEIYNTDSVAITIVEGSGANSWRFNDGSNHILTLVQGSLTIAPGSFAIITNNGAKFIDNYPSYSGTVINTAMSLNNTSDTLRLSSDKGVTFFGDVTYQNTWGGDGNGKTLERKNDSWIESAVDGGTPGVENITPLNPPLSGGTDNPPNPPLQGGQDGTASSTEENAISTGQNTTPLNPPLSGGTYKLGEVVINEFVSDPADSEVEWIELLNKSGKEINLTGWRIEDGSKAKTNLSGVLGASGAGRYKVVEQPNGNLNNAGDLIILFDANGKIIDQVAYGNWNDGNAADNAPITRDPDSLARKFDGYNTYNNLNDFAITLKPTKGAANIIEAENEISLQTKAGFDFSNDIYLVEILPNPTGDDTKLEFIEIHNRGNREVNLTGWSLSNEDNKKINLEKIVAETIIKANGHLAFFRPQTKLVLHNDQGEVKLFEPLADKPFQTVEYKNVKEGWSYNLTPLTPLLKGGEWTWSEAVTPGTANIIKAVNHAPEVEFNFPEEILMGTPVIFDSSDTFDRDDDTLKYAWDFGDGFKNNLVNPEHTYLKTGIYKVQLAVSDGQATSTKEKTVKAVGNINEMAGAETPLNPPLSGGIENERIIINEIMPDPEGADTGNEWLELKNQTEERINLLNWRVENSNGKYKFKNDLWIKANGFYLLNNAVSKLAYKNSDDTVSLYNNLDELVGQAEYTEAIQGESYARGQNGKWFWTATITPGKENKISLADSKISKNLEVRSKNENAEIYLETDLEKIREMEIGSLVKVKGTVAVEPGILGAQIFYIVGSPGIQIYNYKKDFPALKIGDYIEVQGELTQTQGELRLKTKDKNDFKLIKRLEAPVALALSCDQVNEEAVAQLITVTGEITDKNSSTLYLDDGNDEILVYLKKATGIDTKTIEPGQTFAITGILSRTQTGLRLLPRGPQDMVRLGETGLEPQVLGETIEADEWQLAERDKKMELFKYLLIIFGGIIIVLVGLFIKIKKKI